MFKATDCSTGASLIILVRIESIQVAAVVDTAAHLTIIGNHLLKRLPGVRAPTKVVKLRNAEKGAHMDSWLFPKVRIEIGAHSYLWDVVAAPIEDELLLGIDFFEARAALNDLSQPP